MVSSLNFNNLSVDQKTGQVSFSGLQSGIDFQGIVNSIIKARQIPVDTLQANVTSRKDQIAAYNDLKTLLTNLKQSLSKLYGATSFQNVNDDFQAKSVSAATSRSDGQAPADAASLMSAPDQQFRGAREPFARGDAHRDGAQGRVDLRHQHVEHARHLART